jgi:hypothetical protein
MSYPVRYYYASQGKRVGPVVIPGVHANSAIEANELIKSNLPADLSASYSVDPDIGLKDDRGVFFWNAYLNQKQGGRKRTRTVSRRRTRTIARRRTRTRTISRRRTRTRR